MENSKVKIMKYIILILFTVIGCKSQPEYTLVRDNLYKDKDNKLYIKAINNTLENNPQTIYISEVYLKGREKSVSIYKVLDEKSYNQLENSNYSKDKNYTYFLRETLEGGFFYVLDTYPKKFYLVKKNGVVFGVSGNQYYYNGEAINKDSIR